jgi:hypothetical protein
VPRQGRDFDKLSLVPDTKWWAVLLPTQKLEMGLVHRLSPQDNATQDCSACHY